MFENIQLAFQGVFGHKLRSFLTMLGIIIGIASIITIISTIKGTNEQIKQNLIGSGSNIVNVQLYQNDWAVDMSYQTPDGIRVLQDEQRDEMIALDGVADVTLYRSRENVEGFYYRNTGFSGKLYGVDDHYFSVYGYEVRSGRGFTARDFASASKNVILDETAAKTLFSSDDPIGKIVEISGEPFTVVGVVSQKSSFEPRINSVKDYAMYVQESSGLAFVPTSVWPVLYRFDEPQNVAVRATSTDTMTDAGKAVADYLTSHQIIASKATGDNSYSYRSDDLLKQAQQLQEMSSATNNQLIWIASISLLVGGVGVMNIMLVTVTERTAEIGLKKAIGAKRRRILAQFLTEASVLTGIGGLLGVLGGIGMSQLISKFMDTPTALSVPAILVAVVFSVLIGLIFGLVPAVKASKLNPIEALRREYCVFSCSRPKTGRLHFSVAICGPFRYNHTVPGFPARYLQKREHAWRKKRSIPGRSTRLPTAIWTLCARLRPFLTGSISSWPSILRSGAPLTAGACRRPWSARWRTAASVTARSASTTASSPSIRSITASAIWSAACATTWTTTTRKTSPRSTSSSIRRWNMSTSARTTSPCRPPWSRSCATTGRMSQAMSRPPSPPCWRRRM